MKNRTAIFALLAAATLCWMTVALSKLSISWLGPYWLTTARFLVAAPILGFFGRKHLRASLKPRVVLSGALGFGVVMLFQNAGIAQTSVSHAAVIVGAVPVMVALLATGMGHARPAKLTWLGYAVGLLGIIMVAGGGGGGASTLGDGLVLISVLLCAAFIVMQPLVLHGRNPAAVTAVQFAAGALISLPFSLIVSGMPHAPASSSPVIAFAALAVLGTVVPFWLFAYGQSRVAADLAGAFLNVEPLVGAIIGWVFFSDPAGLPQLSGAVAVVAGILISTVEWSSVDLDRAREFARERIDAGQPVSTESC